MQITYDREADAAYIYFRERGKYARMTRFAPGLNADFDKQGRLFGIEILAARRHLPRRVLTSAKRLDRKS